MITTRTIFRIAAFFFCICIQVFLSGSVMAAAKDAQRIQAILPDTVVTSQIFSCTLKMKNTGTDAWYESMNNTLCELRSQEPAFNNTWGTNIITLGQGRRVNPGDTFTFVANIRAPAHPGIVACSWQMYSYGERSFFGDVIRKNIFVLQGDTSDWVWPEPAAYDLTYDDFEYMGSFTTPNGVSDDLWTSSPLALRRMADGTRRLFMRSRWVGVYEAVIPDPKNFVKIENNNVSSLPRASLVRILGTVNVFSLPWYYSGVQTTSNCGLYWEDNSRILYASYYDGYYTQAPFPVLSATRLSAEDTDTTKTFLKNWFLPGTTGKWKAYWYGLTKLSHDFAAEYTGGREFAVGFGGYFSICATASRGPALAAAARPDLTKDTLDILPMLVYSDESNQMAIRDGNYFASRDELYWYRPPENLKKGYWSAIDEVWTGVFIDLPDKKGYIAFASIGTGRYGYDYGAVTRGGTESNWYFYRYADLGAAAQGRVPPGSLQPYAIQRVSYPAPYGVSVSGSCFDEERRMLYVNVPGSTDTYPNPSNSVIHVYRLKGSMAAVGNIALAKWDKTALSICPNPFKVSTTIAISKQPFVATQADVRIYSVGGTQTFGCITDCGHLKAGIAWDASQQPSGVYIVRVTVGNKNFSKRAILQK